MDRRNLPWILIAILLVVVVITVLFIQLSQPAGPDIDLTELGPAENVARWVADDGSYHLGEKEAPVELVIYEDYGCTACSNFKRTSERTFLQDFVASGDVQVEIYPVGIVSGQISIPALEALYCAESYGYFWEYRHLLFTNFPNGLNQEKYIAFSSYLGIDKSEFINCLTSNEFSDLIVNQNQEAWAKGVQNTPTFQINGELYSGILYQVPEDSEDQSLEKLLNAALNK